MALIVLEMALRSLAVEFHMIISVAAGNDSCNTANYTPTRTPEAFIVGATEASRLALGLDARANFSRIGANISVFAPRTNVPLLNFNGVTVTSSGTSFAAPYMAGMFAVSCQAAGTLCATATNSGTLTQRFKILAC